MPPARETRDASRQTRYFLLASLAALVFLSQGCASLSHYNTLPANLEDQAQIPGLPDVRAWADAPSKVLLLCL